MVPGLWCQVYRYGRRLSELAKTHYSASLARMVHPSKELPVDREQPTAKFPDLGR